MPAQTRQNATTTAFNETASSVANPNVGTENSVANSSMSGVEDSQTPTLDLATDEELRDTEMVFKYNAERRLRSKGEPYDTINSRIATYESTQLKDGASLTPEEIICLAVSTMWEKGVDITVQRTVLNQIFFGGHTPNYGDDHIKTIQHEGGNVTLTFGVTSDFQGLDADFEHRELIKPMSFTGPTAYEGLDTNQWESRVDAAQYGYKVGAYNVSAGPGSVMTRTSKEFLLGFQSSPAGRKYQGIPLAELESTPGFAADLLKYRHDEFMILWYRRAQHHVTEAIMANLGGPPGPVTAEWVQQAVGIGIDYLTAWKEPNFLAEPHAVITPEDEAVIRAVIAKMAGGVKVNLDPDANGGRNNIRMTGVPPSPKVGTEEVAPTVVLSEEEVALKEQAEATRMTIYAIQQQQAHIRAEEYTLISSDDNSPLYKHLSDAGKARWASFDIQHKKHWEIQWKIKDAGELRIYSAFLTAWEADELTAETDPNKAGTSAALASALAAFKAYQRTGTPTF